MVCPITYGDHKNRSSTGEVTGKSTMTLSDIDRKFQFYEFFSFLKFNEFYEFFSVEKKFATNRNFANHRRLTSFNVLECNVHL